jgi:hypothetical protein
MSTLIITGTTDFDFFVYFTYVYIIERHMTYFVLYVSKLLHMIKTGMYVHILVAMFIVKIYLISVVVILKYHREHKPGLRNNYIAVILNR